MAAASPASWAAKRRCGYLPPSFAAPPTATFKLILDPFGEAAQDIIIEADRNLYSYEADALAAAVANGAVISPAQGADDATGNMRVLDQWRAQIGLTYPQETPARLTATASNEALQASPGAMRYGTLPHVHDQNGALKPISKIVLGTMLEGAIEPLTHGLALFDDYFERGGTCFDTARIYGTEKYLGHWLRTRGVRDAVTVIGKGAHTPNCNPAGLARELTQSLDALGVEGVDIYMLHRDNLEVPVGEFVDALNEHTQAGRMREFGGSNWSLERLQAANNYAQSKGLQGFSVVSNNFSLARLVARCGPLRCLL